ncbi:MAG: response regulator [SAR324 cluster bacterium]|nr:response regulator [SAR324 cluster bacterium]
MNNPRILIVDDEASIRQSYLSILKPDTQAGLDEMASFLFDDEPDLLNDEEEFQEAMEEAIIVERELNVGEYEIVEASRGAEAVEAVKHSVLENNPFSLVFLDMRMPPGINGLEAAKKIREYDPFVEIVIMTAYADYNFEEIAEEIGNPQRLLYFNKPFHPEQITQLAASITQRWYLEKNLRDQEKGSAS